MLKSRDDMLESLRSTKSYLSPPEVARVLDRPLSTVYYMIHSGQFGEPEVGPGGRIRVPYHAVENYIRTGGGA